MFFNNNKARIRQLEHDIVEAVEFTRVRDRLNLERIKKLETLVKDLQYRDNLNYKCIEEFNQRYNMLLDYFELEETIEVKTASLREKNV